MRLQDYAADQVVCDTPEVGPIAQALDRVQGITNLLRSANETLYKTSDRLQGSAPTASANGTKLNPVRSGELGNLMDALDELWDTASATSGAASSLSRL